MLHIWLRGVIYDKSRIFPLYWDQGEMPAQSGAGVQTEGGAAMIGREAAERERRGDHACGNAPPVPAADRPENGGEKRPAVWPRLCQGGGHGGDDRSGGDKGLHHGVRRAGELSGEKADFRLCDEIS